MAIVIPIHASISSNTVEAANTGIVIIHNRIEAGEIGSKKNKA